MRTKKVLVFVCVSSFVVFVFSTVYAYVFCWLFFFFMGSNLRRKGTQVVVCTHPIEPAVSFVCEFFFL